MFQRRWSPASKLFAGLAVVFGLAAFVIVRGYASRIEALSSGAPARVVVAGRDIARGTTLTPEMTRAVTMPSRFAPPGALRSVGEVAGRVLLTDARAGEPLTVTRVGRPDAGSIASQVPGGLRAFVVPSTLPAGAVRSGDRVDVLATYTGGAPYTETVGAALEVLLVLGEKGQSLVLLVDPDQAEQLAFARSFADLSVSIVGAEEEATPAAATGG